MLMLLPVAGFYAEALILYVNVVNTFLAYFLGPQALYRGIVPCLLRAFPANAALFVAYEWTKKLLG